MIADLSENAARLQTVENMMRINSYLLVPLLKQYANETKQKEEDEKFKRTIYHTWKKLENPSGPLVPVDQSGPVERIIRALERLPARSHRTLTEIIREIAESVMKIVTKPLESTQELLRIALPVVYLAFDALLSIRRWWNGQISGKRCVKNVIDVGVGIGAGVIVGVASSFILGPFGIIAGVAAGRLAAKASEEVTGHLFEEFFGLP